jgi:hypothetical protein
MADLPAKPSLDHLRRQARDLLRAAQAGDTKAAGRIRAVSDVLTLANLKLRRRVALKGNLSCGNAVLGLGNVARRI